jgi:hypothetical protein
VVRGDPDGLPNGRDPARPSPSGTGMGERLFGVLVEKQAGGHQVASDDIGREAVQCGELAADFGGKLLGFDVGRQAWAVPDGAVGRLVARLCRASASRPGRTRTAPALVVRPPAIIRPSARSAAVGCSSGPAPFAVAIPVVDHLRPLTPFATKPRARIRPALVEPGPDRGLPDLPTWAVAVSCC